MLDFLRRFTLKARLLAAMALATVALLGLGVWGVVESQLANARSSALIAEGQRGADAVARLRESLGTVRRLQADAIATGSNAVEVERIAGLWKQETARAAKLGAELAAADADDADLAALVRQQQAQLAAYTGVVGPVLEKLQAATVDSAGALAYAEQGEEHVVALGHSADAMLKAVQARQQAILHELAAATALAANLRLG